MKTLYLVRHGESTQNTGVNQLDRIPDHAVPLTSNGCIQAEEAGRFLANLLVDVPPEKIVLWRSPYERTRQTSIGILTTLRVGKEKEDDMLAELQFGIFDALSKADMKRQFPDEWQRYINARRFNGKFFARRPGGESPFDCEIRQKLWLDTLYRDINRNCQEDHFVVVGHGAQINILRKAIFHYNYEWYETVPNPGNCSIQMVTLSSGGNQDCGYIYGAPQE